MNRLISSTGLRKCTQKLSWRLYGNVAIVGTGPSGFYCAKELLKCNPELQIDMYERLHVPYGLLRYGVAPDHPEVKNASITCEQVAEDPRVRWVGNVEVGKDVSVQALQEHYNAIVFGYGASLDKTLGVKGEDLKGVWGAREFVEWYNGMPGVQDRDFRLSKVRNVAILGMGNVAIDCARLVNAPSNLLEGTDCSSYAVHELLGSAVTNTQVIARRGPLQAQFTIKEFRELVNLGRPDGGKPGEPNPWLDVLIPEGLAEEAAILAASKRPKKRLMDLLATTSKQPRASGRTVEFKFFRVPIEFRGDDDGYVKEAVCAITQVDDAGNCRNTGQVEVVPCELVLRSIGYRSCAVEGVPFDEKRGKVHTDSRHRVLTLDGNVLSGMYATGWAGTGPVGVVATTMNNAFDCARTISEDFSSGKLKVGPTSGFAGIKEVLVEREVRVVGWKEWREIEAEEARQGKSRGKVAEKIYDNVQFSKYVVPAHDVL